MPTTSWQYGHSVHHTSVTCVDHTASIRAASRPALPRAGPLTLGHRDRTMSLSSAVGAGVTVETGPTPHCVSRRYPLGRRTVAFCGAATSPSPASIPSSCAQSWPPLHLRLRQHQRRAGRSERCRPQQTAAGRCDVGGGRGALQHVESDQCRASGAAQPLAGQQQAPCCSLMCRRCSAGHASLPRSASPRTARAP